MRLHTASVPALRAPDMQLVKTPWEDVLWVQMGGGVQEVPGVHAGCTGRGKAGPEGEGDVTLAQHAGAQRPHKRLGTRWW